MSVKLRKRKLKGKKAKSQYRFYLDIYTNGERNYKFLKDLVLNENDTKEKRKEIEQLAEQVRAKEERKIFNEEHGIPSRDNQKIEFITYFTQLINEKEVKKTKETWNNTLNYLQTYSRK